MGKIGIDEDSACRKLWPECVLEKSKGLDVSGQDVEELVDDHREELTTEELQDLQMQHQQMAAEEIASEEEEERGENVPFSVIKDVCAKWSEV